jgi:hypothetical protein
MTRARALAPLLALAAALALAGCGQPERPLDRALVLALSVFPPDAEGKPSTTPGAATLVFLRRDAAGWSHEVLQDPESNVFHKALAWTPPGEEPGILTIAGDGARLKLWRKRDGAWSARTLWAPAFGGKRDRLRDLELADIDGDGALEAAIATHDQGVVAIVEIGAEAALVRELDRAPDTFVHEVEVGDVDGDGAPELYTTPSQPNRFDGEPQRGHVIRYRPDGSREQFADLGDRHAKEVLVADLDGDARPEVYVAVEGRVENRALVAGVEIRRYAAAGGEGAVIARLEDSLCRFLVPADVDGDGQRELVAATFKAGVWLLRPQPGEWRRELVDGDSSSFEHAVAALDLDGDGRDELYVAADDQNAVRRYVFEGGAFRREEIFRPPPALRGFTWNVTAVPVELTR